MAGIIRPSVAIMGSIVEGILIGRFVYLAATGPALHGFVTGWNSSYIDRGHLRRVWEVEVQGVRGRLRVNEDAKSPAGFAGRIKFFRPPHSQGDDRELDLNVTRWDGAKLSFQVRLPFFFGFLSWQYDYEGAVADRHIAGMVTRHLRVFRFSFPFGQFPWKGQRAEVLTHGTAALGGALRAWQERTRAQLHHLMMGRDPQPLPGSFVEVKSVAQIPGAYPADRDDDPDNSPTKDRRYQMWELHFTFVVPDGQGGQVTRKAHGYLTLPTVPLSTDDPRYPAVVTLNGHQGSAWKMMELAGMYWYGDSFASHEFITLALDTGHRPEKDRGVPQLHLHPDDDSGHENGYHPAVGNPTENSIWAEDGERAWDALRGLDLLLNVGVPIRQGPGGTPENVQEVKEVIRKVKPGHVLVTGLSMGGEVALMAGALDPRFNMVIASGYATDTGKEFPIGKTLFPPPAVPPQGLRCTQWTRANMSEYVDSPDFIALVAERPQVFTTGLRDGTASNSNPLVMCFKQQARRGRAAYGAQSANFVHYLHERGHNYRVGNKNLAVPPYVRNIKVPVITEPSQPFNLSWQTDERTQDLPPAGDLYALIGRLLP
ncbi:MAG: hypothetical protein HY234_13065 [Acidobacteria bacterium]|nr:hypothetical protein [Acidobacteriota bacterium]